jgi:hypothetical protein
MHIQYATFIVPSLMIGDAILIYLALIRSCHTDHGERNCLCTWLSYKFEPKVATEKLRLSEEGDTK